MQICSLLTHHTRTFYTFTFFFLFFLQCSTYTLTTIAPWVWNMYSKKLLHTKWNPFHLSRRSEKIEFYFHLQRHVSSAKIFFFLPGFSSFPYNNFFFLPCCKWIGGKIFKVFYYKHTHTHIHTCNILVRDIYDSVAICVV